MSRFLLALDTDVFLPARVLGSRQAWGPVHATRAYWTVRPRGPVAARSRQRCRSAGSVEYEIAAQFQQDMVGSQQSEPRATGLRHEQAVERVMPGELGEVADRLGVLGSDTEQLQ